MLLQDMVLWYHELLCNLLKSCLQGTILLRDGLKSAAITLWIAANLPAQPPKVVALRFAEFLFPEMLCDSSSQPLGGTIHFSPFQPLPPNSWWLIYGLYWLWKNQIAKKIAKGAPTKKKMLLQVALTLRQIRFPNCQIVL